MEIVTDVDKLSVDLQDTFMKYKTIKQWAYIIHDKDDTRPHYHIYLNFGKSSVDTSLVAQWFGVAENFINKVKGRKTDMLLYLTHGNESQKNKHQYSPTEVIANFDFEVEIEQSKIIGDFKTYSYAQQLQYVESLPIDEKVKAYTRLKKLWELYCQTTILNTDRRIDVIFFCGKGGTGKTYTAKKLLTSMGFDFCISSSSNDPFQDYMGQKAIVLDDLRDTSFEFEDLLKILDNNTNSSVKSRFNNKVFNGEVIAITSSIPLAYWYGKMKYERGGLESLKQLYRRVTSYVEVTLERITIYDDLDEYGKPVGVGRVFKNELAELTKEKTQKTDFVSAFEKICETEVVFGEQLKITT